MVATCIAFEHLFLEMLNPEKLALLIAFPCANKLVDNSTRIARVGLSRGGEIEWHSIMVEIRNYS